MQELGARRYKRNNAKRRKLITRGCVMLKLEYRYECKPQVSNFMCGVIFNPLNADLTLRRLMSYIYIFIYIYIYIYIYMDHPFLMILDHTQRRSTVGRTPLDE